MPALDAKIVHQAYRCAANSGMIAPLAKSIIEKTANLNGFLKNTQAIGIRGTPRKVAEIVRKAVQPPRSS